MELPIARGHGLPGLTRLRAALRRARARRQVAAAPRDEAVAPRDEAVAPRDEAAATQRDRGDVPGWVLIAVMTAGLVTVLWAVAGPRLTSMLEQALDSVVGP
ncbi:MAG TPA: hypothetical protein VKG85_05730 [Actinomycetes bacterium]|nr:hypothetical protein [Actinomycetes bacterium]